MAVDRLPVIARDGSMCPNCRTTRPPDRECEFVRCPVCKAPHEQGDRFVRASDLRGAVEALDDVRLLLDNLDIDNLDIDDRERLTEIRHRLRSAPEGEQ